MERADIETAVDRIFTESDAIVHRIMHRIAALAAQNTIDITGMSDYANDTVAE